MTGFALVLWAYYGRAIQPCLFSLMSFCNHVPYVSYQFICWQLYIDRHRKKAIMLVSDSIAAAGSLAVLAFLLAGHLSVWHIYLINIIVGVTNAFQQPASAVTQWASLCQRKRFQM